MRLLRAAIAVGIGVTAFMLINCLSIAPYRANILKKRIEREFDSLYGGEGRATSFVAFRVARMRLQQLQSALHCSPTDADLRLLLAAHHAVLGDSGTEIAAYRDLLRFHRRPEIYQSLGMAEFGEGHYDAAVEQFGTAMAFDYLYIHQVPEGLKDRAAKAAERRQLATRRLLTRE